MKKRHIGIFPGVFDPVHEGHIAFGLAALSARNLDTVLFIPEPSPWHKTEASAVDDRLAMLHLATAAHTQLEATPLIAKRFAVGPLLEELTERFPHASFSLLVGSDVARYSLSQWQDVDLLLDTMPLIVGLRNMDTVEEILPLLPEKAQANAVFVATKVPLAKSTAIRNKSRTHHHPEVTDYITAHRLYE